MRKKNDILLPASSSLAGMGFSSSWVFTSIYMHSSLGVSYFFAGLVFTVSGAVAAVSQIYAGRLGDRFGHREILLFLIMVSGIGYFLIFYVSNYFHRPLIFSALFVLNISVNSAILSPLNSLVSLSSSSPLKGFSYLRMGNNVGWGFGPVIGGAIVTLYGYPYIYLLGLAMNAANAVLVLLVTAVRGTVTEKPERKGLRIDPLFFYLGITALLLFMIQGQESVTLPNFASSFRSLSAFAIGIIFFVNGLFVILFQVPVSRITSRIGLSHGYVIGILLYVVGFFSMAFDFTLTEFVISMGVATIGENFAFPAGNAIVSALSGNRDIGHHMGVFNGFISMGRSIGPAVGGVALFLFYDPVRIWAAVTVSGVISVMLYMMMLSRRVNEAEKYTGPSLTQ